MIALIGFFVAFFVTLIVAGGYQVYKNQKEMNQLKQSIKKGKANGKTIKAIDKKPALDHQQSNQPHADLATQMMMQNAVLHGAYSEDSEREKAQSRYEGNDKELFTGRTDDLHATKQHYHFKSSNYYGNEKNSYDGDKTVYNGSSSDSSSRSDSSHGSSYYDSSSYSSSDSSSYSSDSGSSGGSD